MAGAEFEYDERGGTFFYFLISFYALVLIPATYYLWPSSRSKKDSKSDQKRCHCEGCEAKEQQKKLKQPWSVWKKRILKFCLILAWVGFALLAYKVAHIEDDHVEYDPFVVLDIDKGSTDRQIKKAYHKLSLQHHPDRGGDPKKFLLISKAYQALTNAESKENWEKYGNPDGPGATQFGIALPKWLVSKEYGSFVLFGYIFLFMIVLPIVVGVWWYNSIKYSVDQVLMDTTHLYGYMFSKTPHMILRRILMVLGGSFEFAKPYNPEIVERPSDDKEVPMLIKSLENLGEKNKERPLCYPYSLKARALIYAHLGRMPLPPDTLDRDRISILRKCPILVNEMVNILSQLVMLASAGRVPRMPSLETIENVMRVLPMIVQAMWDKQSPLLQLPHFTEDMLRHCVTKKRRIKTTSDLASLDEDERRSLFRSLNDSQYDDIRTVLASMPCINLDYETEVQGEDDKQEITAGSLVTVKVRLSRKSLLDFADGDPRYSLDREEEDEEAGDNEEEEEETLQNGEVNSGEQNQQVKQRKPWEKNKKKQKKGGNKSKKPPQKPVQKAPETPEVPPESKRKRREKDKETENSADEESGSEISDDSDVREALDDLRRPVTDDEDAMEFDDDLIKKERILETKSKITHTVHCPHFPEEKYEWWWVYLCDKKRRALISGPVSCTSLVTEEEVELKFQAPAKPGVYSFQLCVKSDSYIDADQTKDIKMSVSERREIKSHPQWEFSSDEEEKKSESEHSDGSEYTEGEEDDD